MNIDSIFVYKHDFVFAYIKEQIANDTGILLYFLKSLHSKGTEILVRSSDVTFGFGFTVIQ